MMFAECSLVMFAVQALVFSPLVKPEWTRWLFTPGLAILALSLFVVPFADTNFTMIVAVALVAASAGILSPIVTYWVSLSAGETQGADLGRVTAAASLGQALGSAAGGLLFGVSILPSAAFTVTAAVVLAGLTASLGLPRRLQHDHASRSAAAPGEGSCVSMLPPTLNR
jgi:predicted MFS family arabinose efflux permease